MSSAESAKLYPDADAPVGLPVAGTEPAVRPSSITATSVTGWKDSREVFTVYEIESQISDGTTRSVTHRYSDFEAMSQSFENVALFTVPKQWLMGAAAKDARAAALQAYLRKLLASCADDRCLREFLLGRAGAAQSARHLLATPAARDPSMALPASAAADAALEGLLAALDPATPVGLARTIVSSYAATFPSRCGPCSTYLHLPACNLVDLKRRAAPS